MIEQRSRTNIIKAVVYIVVGALLLTACLRLQQTEWQGNAALHVLMAFTAMLLALFGGVIVLARFYAKRNNVLLFIGAGFIGAGLLDGYHAIVTSLYVEQFFPLAALSSLAWSWNVSPVFLSILVFGSWLAWGREVEAAGNGRLQGRVLYTTLVLLGLANVLYFILAPSPPALQNAYTPGRMELFISTTFFLWALAGYLDKGHWRHTPFDFWLVLSLIVCFLGQALFMFFSSRLFDALFTVANLLKQIGYLCVLIGSLASMYDIFKQSERSATALARTNCALRQEIVERQRAETTAHQQRQLAEALREVGIALSATLDFDELLDCLLEQMARVLPYDTANVMLVENGDVRIVCTRGYGQHLMQFPARFAVAEIPTLQHMAATPQPLIIPDTAVHPIWVKAEASPHVRSWAGTPIVVHRRVVAFLALNNSKPHFYQPEDASRLTAFAAQASIAIQNARLYTNLQELVEERTADLRSANAELETALQLREDFSNMIIHDIRAPLTNILIYCDLLEEKMPASEQSDEELDTIRHSAERLSAFVGDMLLMARMEHGRLVLNRSLTDVNKLVQSVQENYRFMARLRDIRLVVDTPKQSVPLSLDANLWRRVLDNLVTNAIKFSPVGGSVSIKVSYPATEAAPRLRIRVIDTGPGIPTEYHETIFDKFEVVASERRDVTQVGLGLAFCKMVVEAHDGRISITNNQPHGAIFTVEV